MKKKNIEIVHNFMQMDSPISLNPLRTSNGYVYCIVSETINSPTASTGQAGRFATRVNLPTNLILEIKEQT